MFPIPELFKQISG